MKKWIAILAALAMMLGLAACAGSEPAAPEADAVPTAGADVGRVCYLSNSPEADAAWQKLADIYTDRTGVEVTVVTVDRENYAEVCNARIRGSDAPTLFHCGNAQELADWKDFCLDLSDSSVLGEMTTRNFNLCDEKGTTRAIACCREAFGILINEKLLEQAGHSLGEIRDFATLKAVADDIHARARALGFDAFAPASLDASAARRFAGHLANMPLYYEFRDDGVTGQPAAIKGSYLSGMRSTWDLYITDSAADPASLPGISAQMAQAEFGEGRAVFYQCGSWEFNDLIADSGRGFAMNPAELAVIPIYIGASGEENAGLAWGTENCWAVNACARQADIDATLDFLYWVVTSDEGIGMLTGQFDSVPFRCAKETSGNPFFNGDSAVDDSSNTVTWVFRLTPNIEPWETTVVTALTKYSADATDASWNQVVGAFVDGWAYEYDMTRG